MNVFKFSFLLFLIIIVNLHASPQGLAKSPYVAFLFVYFIGNDRNDEAIDFATSQDGYHYRSLNNNKAIVASSEISSLGGIRDPHILRPEDKKTF